MHGKIAVWLNTQIEKMLEARGDEAFSIVKKFVEFYMNQQFAFSVHSVCENKKYSLPPLLEAYTAPAQSSSDFDKKNKELNYRLFVILSNNTIIPDCEFLPGIFVPSQAPKKMNDFILDIGRAILAMGLYKSHNRLAKLSLDRLLFLQSFFASACVFFVACMFDGDNILANVFLMLAAFTYVFSLLKERRGSIYYTSLLIEFLDAWLEETALDGFKYFTSVCVLDSLSPANQGLEDALERKRVAVPDKNTVITPKSYSDFDFCSVVKFWTTTAKTPSVKKDRWLANVTDETVVLDQKKIIVSWEIDGNIYSTNPVEGQYQAYPIASNKTDVRYFAAISPRVTGDAVCKFIQILQGNLKFVAKKEKQGIVHVEGDVYKIKTLGAKGDLRMHSDGVKHASIAPEC